MNYRLIAVRVLYYSLAFAALTGVVAVFVPTNSDFLGRLLGTAITTGFSAGFMLLSVRALEKPKTRILGTTIGIIICIVLPLVYLTIWVDAIPFISGKRIDQLALSALLVFLCGFPLSIGAAIVANEKAKLSGIFLLACWSLLSLLWIFDVWQGNVGKFNIYESIAIPLAWCSPVAALLLLRWPKSILYLTLLTVSCVLWQWHYIRSTDWVEHSLPLAVIFITAWLPCSIALWYLLTLRKTSYSLRVFEVTAICFGAVSFALCFANAWSDFTQNESEFLLRFAIASSILGGTSVLGVFITQVLKMSMFIKGDTIPLQVVCPRCNAQQSLPQGRSSCSQCNLGFKILFESPACRKCDYDLKGLDEPRCPECGEPVSTTTLQ